MSSESPYSIAPTPIAPPPVAATSGDALQLDRAEATEPIAPAHPSLICGNCGREIAGQYFEIARKAACTACATKYEGEIAEGYSGKTFMRAALNGSLAAILGAVAWGAITSITGYQLGIVAVAVGILVGVTVKRAAKGVGGKRYQALAMFLTYSAVAMANLPPLVKAIRDDVHAKGTTSAPPESPEAAEGLAPAITPKPAADPSPPAAARADIEGAKKPVSLGKFILAWMFLFALSYAVPFFGGAQSILGLLIIGFGVYEAWKINKAAPPAIRGPFRVGG